MGATDLHDWGGGEESTLQGVRDKINPREIAKIFIYFSMSSLHAVQRTARLDAHHDGQADGAVPGNPNKIAKNHLFYI